MTVERLISEITVKAHLVLVTIETEVTLVTIVATLLAIMKKVGKK